MKYLVISLLFLLNNEVMTLLALTIIALMFSADMFSARIRKEQ